MFGLITRTICVGVGYLYPAYKCFKLLRRGPEAIGAAPGAGSQGDVVKGILKYWIVMAGFTAAELVADTFMFWLPFVGLIKVSFIAWMVMPGINGAGIIYDCLVEPYLVQHEERLDGYFRHARAAAQKTTSTASKTAYDRWIGYVQRTISQQQDTPSSSSSSETTTAAAGYSGLTGLLRGVSQSVPQQASAAAGYLAGMSGIGSGPRTQADTVGRSTVSSMLTSWVTAFSSPSMSEISDDQRLHDIRARKTQLQDMVAQLESSESVIVARGSAGGEQPAAAAAVVADEEGEAKRDVHKEASEFEDDAVMVGGNGEGSGSNDGGADAAKSGDAAAAEKKPPSASSRRWFW
ncbi:hypothetical protein LPJ53_003139 [Coemansia erecta]|uniref:Protein YOP1 n=1 Tax=Coemansia erecta TaxID=147472 RepID=A0A9W8CQH7_9FUNG|nr:hypothetical protein LPJ53_003139 [Coemansia erecta]